MNTATSHFAQATQLSVPLESRIASRRDGAHVYLADFPACSDDDFDQYLRRVGTVS